MLHAQILDLLFDYNIRERDRQQVLILVTGDGAVNNGGTSFPIVIERALQKGWHVQLWSWNTSLNQTFFNIQEMRLVEFTIHYLDEYRHEVTFRKENKIVYKLIENELFKTTDCRKNGIDFLSVASYDFKFVSRYISFILKYILIVHIVSSTHFVLE